LPFVNGQSLDVVIVTKDRIGLLADCLKSIDEASTGFEIRIYIGLNGAKSDFKHRLEKIVTSLHSKGRCTISEFDSCLPGAARNVVLQQTKSKWVFFCDDDITVPEDIFKTFFELLSIAPNAFILGGPNITPRNSHSVERAQGYVLSSPFFAGPMSSRYRLGQRDRPAGVSDLTLCNLFVNFQVTRIQFPELFICGEELKLFHQFPNSMFASDRLFVYHSRRKTILGFAKQAYKYGIGRSQASPAASALAWSLVILLLAVMPLAFDPSILQPVAIAWAVVFFLEAVRLAVLRKDLLSFPAVCGSALSLQFGYLLGILFGLLYWKRPIRRSNVDPKPADLFSGKLNE